MDEKIVFDPKLGLTSGEFVQAWNDTYTNQGTARVGEVDGLEAFDLATAGLAIVTGIATGLLTSLTYDLIKHMLAQRQAPPQFNIQVVEQPDGTKLIVVVIEKS